jgi:hypothetical protein
VFSSLDIEYAMINGLIWIREVLALFGFVFYTGLAYVFNSIFSKTAMPQWFAEIFSGVQNNMTFGEKVACLALKSYNFLILFLIVVFAVFLAMAIVESVSSPPILRRKEHVT